MDENQVRKPGSGMGIGGWVLLGTVLAIVIVVMWPMVFTRTDGKSPHARCTGHLKQLTTQMQMFASEHNQHLPSQDWVRDLGIDAPSMPQCPSVKGKQGDVTRVDYGYNGLLLAPDGMGISEQQILYTTEVGAFADSTSSSKGAPGIINGGGMLPASRAVTLSTRHEGTIVAFVDGHAKYFPGKTLRERDMADPLTRAFVAAPALGIASNYAGGVSDFPVPDGLEKAEVAVGGEYCTRPVLAAAAGIWGRKAGASVADKGFRGQDYAKPRKAKHIVWGHADGTQPPRGIAIARDAVVVIVAKNTKITPGNLAGFVPSDKQVRASITRDGLRTAYQTGNPDASGATGQYQFYHYDQYSGTRRFFERGMGYSKDKEKGRRLTVADDAEMVEKVSQDPFGIGYCSLAMTDPTKVDVLVLKDDSGIAHYLPNTTANVPSTDWWLMPEAPPADYPFVRTLYVVCTGKAWNAEGTAIGNVMFAPGGAGTVALQDGPLFRAGYWRP